ncbi:DUF4436 family protein [Nocardia sp. NPDC052566]|uniref:DUF4436 family protein n=1 Tax=Nocardia sp. NPDC052566 TaxID=3364330 RepID=UPI0037CA6BE2
MDTVQYVQEKGTRKSRRGGALWCALSVVGLIVLLAASLSMYALGRTRSETVHAFGALDTVDRVDLNVWIGKLDPSIQTATVELAAMPQGRFADESGAFKSDTVLYASGLKAEPIKFKAGEPISAVEVKVPMTGMFTDYPFDRYKAVLSFGMSSGDASIPLSASVTSGDTFFAIDERLRAGSDEAPHSIDLSMDARRSTPSLVFALFVMLLMLGLALAAAIACFYVLNGRRGLLFPACSMMGALLFALVPLRNAVSGGPPIGSIIDFSAFFLAEGIISFALVASVVIGYRVEIAKERAERQSGAETPQEPVSAVVGVESRQPVASAPRP